MGPPPHLGETVADAGETAHPPEQAPEAPDPVALWAPLEAPTAVATATPAEQALQAPDPVAFEAPPEAPTAAATATPAEQAPEAPEPVALGAPPEAPAAAAAAATAKPARRGYGFWAVAGIAVAGLVAAGAVVGHRSSSENVSTSQIVADGVTVPVPSGWERIDPPAMPGVALPGAVAIAARNGNGKLIVARGLGRWPTLLPAAFVDRAPSVSDLIGRRTVVQLGTRQALRYADVSLRGEPAHLTVFVVPDRGRVALLSCAIPSGAAATASKKCAQTAAAVRLPASAPYSLVPSPTYTRTLSLAVERLNQARATGRTELAAAGTVAAQSSAARRIGAAYGLAARRLDAQRTGLLVAPLNTKIVAQMGLVRAAYARLAQAALADQASLFADAKRLVHVRETGLEKLFQQLPLAGISTR